MKLELAILAGPESKKFLADFTEQLDRLEAMSGKLTGKKAKSTAAVDDEDEETDPEEDDDFVAPKKSAKGKTTKKAKGPTIDDVNDACKAYTEENGIAATKKLLKKKFGSVSISQIDEDEWTAVIKALAV